LGICRRGGKGKDDRELDFALGIEHGRMSADERSTSMPGRVPKKKKNTFSSRRRKEPLLGEVYMRTRGCHKKKKKRLPGSPRCRGSRKKGKKLPHLIFPIARKEGEER